MMTSLPHHVIARSEATWQSPGSIHGFAEQGLTLYREIPTGLTALGMTYVEMCVKRKNRRGMFHGGLG